MGGTENIGWRKSDNATKSEEEYIGVLVYKLFPELGE